MDDCYESRFVKMYNSKTSWSSFLVLLDYMWLTDTEPLLRNEKKKCQRTERYERKKDERNDCLSGKIAGIRAMDFFWVFLLVSLIAIVLVEELLITIILEFILVTNKWDIVSKNIKKQKNKRRVKKT